MNTPATERSEVEELLDQLQRESQERRRELQELAAELPVATSRRALVRSMFASVADAPDKPLVVKRVALKILRQPAELVRRMRTR
jgi:hypothetical protein